MSLQNQQTPTASKNLLVWVFLIAVLGGLTALGQQLLWTRRMVDISGGTAESASRVLGCFFLGLSLGAACAAWRGCREIVRPWRMLALIEGGIILSGIGFFLLPPGVDWVWSRIGLEAAIGWQGSIIKTLVSVIAILPPAFLMGWFLPIAIKAMRWNAQSFSRKGLILYAVNTFGGVIGLMVISLIALEQFGVRGAFMLLLGLHTLCLLVFLFLDYRSPPVCKTQIPRENAPHDSIASTTSDNTHPGILLGLAFFSGFAVLAAEVIVLKMVLLVAPLSFHAPAVVLTVVILALAMAAWFAAAVNKSSYTLGGCMWLAAITSLLAPFVFYGIAKWTGGLPTADSFVYWWLRLVALTALAFGPGFFFAGFVFPLLSSAWSQSATTWKSRPDGGHAWGWLLAVSGLGGLLGAEFAYRILLPAAGIYQSLGWIALAYAIVALACAGVFQMKNNPLRPFRGKVVVMGGMVLVVVILLPILPTVNPHLPATVIWERSGADGTVAVVEFNDGDRAILVSNQYFLGSISGRYSQERQGHLPLLLHPQPHCVGFLGVATGMTPAAAVIQTAPQKVEAFEISRSVLSVSAEYFGEFNQHLETHPHVRLVREDARLAMTASRDRYDVIIGDLFLPWGPGEARLFTREHFLAVRDSIRAGGLFAQWLPLYQLTESHLSSIVESMRSAFPEVHFFIGKLTTGDPILALVAWRDGGAPNWRVVEERVQQEQLQLSDPLLRHLQGVRLLYLGQELALPAAPVNTLNNMHLELRASRDRIVRGDESYLNGPFFLAWLEQQPSVPGFNPALQLLRWQNDNLGRRELSDFAARWIPEAILGDENANWAAWPGPMPRRTQ